MAQTRTNTLGQSHPEVAVQWHPAKNGSLTPEKVLAGSAKKAWWICPKGPDHEWEARVADRTSGSGCPCCAGLKVSVTNSFASLCPALVAQWHPTKNGSITPAQVIALSRKKYWWKCSHRPDHNWLTSPGSRLTGLKKNIESGGCPACRGRAASVTNSLESLRPDLASEWDHDKNNDLNPDKITLLSTENVWWICPLKHSYQTSPYYRNKRSRGCSVCARRTVDSSNSLKAVRPGLANE